MVYFCSIQERTLSKGQYLGHKVDVLRISRRGKWRMVKGPRTEFEG